MTQLPDEYLEQILQVLKENWLFCNSDDTGLRARHEIVELMNDAIDNLRWGATLRPNTQAVSRFAMVNFLYTVLLPLSFGIHLDFLAGNLPSCFMQLRGLAEHLARSFQADLLFPQLDFFQDRLKGLEPKRISAVIGSVDQRLLDLWRRLSNRWVHMGTREPIVEATVERGVPGYALVVPVPYGPEEIPDLDELQRSVARFREVLKSTVEKWKTRVSSE